MLEGTHGHFTNKIRVDDSLLQSKWQQGVEMRQDQVGLVVRSRIEGGQCEATVVKVLLVEHGSEHGHNAGLQVDIVRWVGVGEGVAKSL